MAIFTAPLSRVGPTRDTTSTRPCANASGVTRLLHLSDLHLLAADREEQPAVLEALVEAAGTARQERGAFDLILISGDVFDSAKLEPFRAVAAFLRLLRALRHALDAEVPAVVVPGNHDSRTGGLIGPHRTTLFEALARAAPPNVFVHGAGPLLAEVVPPEMHGQPLWLIAYDSTYLPRGLIGAGGTLRQQDLLYAAARINGYEPDWPLVMLVHHHLVPTPVTDVEPIHTEDRSPLVRWSVKELLPRLLANADREEWMMTALGAGTALTTLASLGRSVLVLHGHKHNATARLLKGTIEGQGDVLIASAGSAGTAHSVSGSETERAARIWPSFNVVELDRAGAKVDTMAFGWKGRSRGALDRRPLVRAGRRGASWSVRPTPLDFESEATSVRVALDEGVVTRELSAALPNRWDLHVQRRVVRDPDARASRYVATLEGSVLLEGRRVSTPHDVLLGASPTTWVIEGGAPMEVTPGHAPFAWIEMLVRYPASVARLRLEDAPRDIFGSATDAGNGLERPVPITWHGPDATVELAPCPARTLLRIYWSLIPEVSISRAPVVDEETRSPCEEPGAWRSPPVVAAAAVSASFESTASTSPAPSDAWWLLDGLPWVPRG